MKIFLQTIGVLLALATLTLWTISIWSGDQRFGWTGILAMFAALGALAWADFTPRHSDICSGC